MPCRKKNTPASKNLAAPRRENIRRRPLIAAKLKAAAAMWRNFDYTVDDIKREVGLSRRTLYLHLGPRYRR